MKLSTAAICLFLMSVIAVAIIAPRSAEESEPSLIMFHDVNCMYCQNFLTKVCKTTEEDPNRNTHCPGYGLNQNSEKYPLTIFTKKTIPEWIVRAFKDNIIEPIRGTPTFVLWDGEREVGRIVGFGSAEEFYEELERLIKLNRPQKRFQRQN